jgi:hypothetical protein
MRISVLALSFSVNGPVSPSTSHSRLSEQFLVSKVAFGAIFIVKDGYLEAGKSFLNSASEFISVFIPAAEN